MVADPRIELGYVAYEATEIAIPPDRNISLLFQFFDCCLRIADRLLLPLFHIKGIYPFSNNDGIVFPYYIT